MRQLHSDFHFRHALFALQSPDGYVDALLEMARESGRPAAIAFRRSRGRPGAVGARAPLRSR